MSMLVTAGAVDVTTYFHLRLAADGTDATGLTITNIDLQYTRSGATPAAKVDATALGAANSAHSDNTAFEIDGTDQPGVYRVDWPDAAFASGVDEVILTVKCATVFTESLRVRLMSATRGLSGTALPNAAADAAGGLPISDAGGLDLDAQIGADIDAILVDTGTTLDGRIPAALVSGRIDASVGAMAANVLTATAINADAITAAKIADGAIDAATFAASAITSTVLAADAITAAKVAADVTTELQAGLATAAALSTLDGKADSILADTNELQTDWVNGGRLDLLIDSIISKVDAVDDFLDTEIAAILAAVDTEVGAIKTQTDKFVFTVANQVDANVQYVNDTALLGDGSATPWGPV
jgi:hypothetical protein